MYGLWGYLLKAEALAPINAGRVLKGGHPAALFTIFDISNTIACYCHSLKDYLKSRILLYYARLKVLFCHGPTSFSEPISHIFESATN